MAVAVEGCHRLGEWVWSPCLHVFLVKPSFFATDYFWSMGWRHHPILKVNIWSKWIYGGSSSHLPSWDNLLLEQRNRRPTQKQNRKTQQPSVPPKWTEATLAAWPRFLIWGAGTVTCQQSEPWKSCWFQNRVTLSSLITFAYAPPQHVTCWRPLGLRVRAPWVYVPHRQMKMMENKPKSEEKNLPSLSSENRNTPLKEISQLMNLAMKNKPTNPKCCLETQPLSSLAGEPMEAQLWQQGAWVLDVPPTERVALEKLPAVLAFYITGR